MALSQHKYSSHVVEMAFNHADDDSRCAMFLEVFESYEPDRFANGTNCYQYPL